jgi:hypothetical protein
LPSRLDGSETDHETGPPEAVMVSVAGPSRLSAMVAGETVIVPEAAADDDGAGRVGAGRVGAGRVGAGEGDFEAGLVGDVADGDVAGLVGGLDTAGEVAWLVAPGELGRVLLPWLG